MNNTDIKPCPFCGVEVYEGDNMTIRHEAGMADCPLNNETFYDISVESWNTRADEQKPAKPTEGYYSPQDIKNIFKEDEYRRMFEGGALSDNDKIRRELFKESLNHDPHHSAEGAIRWAKASLKAYDKTFNNKETGDEAEE